MTVKYWALLQSCRLSWVGVAWKKVLAATVRARLSQPYAFVKVSWSTGRSWSEEDFG